MLSKFIPILLLIALSCSEKKSAIVPNSKQQQAFTNTNPYPFIRNITVPEGYKRMDLTPGSFAQWLRDLALKKSKTVYLYNGTPKTNQGAQFAVLDIPVGNKDLQQCADAVMRLRAEYQYGRKNYSGIAFTDNDGKIYRFDPPFTRTRFDKYLLKVFGMCGSASLAKQLKTHVPITGVEPGDVLIRGGFPGHAVMVMDVAINTAGKRIYLLAQSYMPAQDIHVLKNPAKNSLSPWFEVNDETLIETPEYTFSKYELRRW